MIIESIIIVTEVRLVGPLLILNMPALRIVSPIVRTSILRAEQFINAVLPIVENF